MTPEPPLVSIIMPAHNAARFIGRAIESIIGQTCSHWHLVIVDDGSTDDTASVIGEFRDPRIECLRIPHSGYPAIARNAGLRAIRGALISFLDADDWYLPRCLEKLSGALATHPSARAAYGFLEAVNEQGVPSPERSPLTARADGGWDLPDSYRHTWDHIVTGRISCVVSGLMIRREALEEIGVFNERLYGVEDYDYYARLLRAGLDTVLVVPEPVYCYRLNPAGLTKRAEHWFRNLADGLSVVDWIYSQELLRQQIRVPLSVARAAHYRYRARERLLGGQPALARQILRMAWSDPRVRAPDWWSALGSLWLRSYLPGFVQSFLVRVKRRHRLQHARGEPSLRV